jgi:hypothetical protein
MKNLFALLVFCLIGTASFSQDNMNKKMDNKTDQMNKKMNSPDSMNKKIGPPTDSTRRKPRRKPDSLHQKIAR